MAEKFYISTAIAYTNALPHVGFALELCQADAIARYHRLVGEEAFFLTGTDEHGRKVAQAAEEAGEEPQKFVDGLATRFQDLAETLNISNDAFIRTTDRTQHWPGVEKMWAALDAKGDLYKKKYQGLYCSGCEAFIPKSDLVDGRCPNHHREPEVLEEENYFFRLSRYQDALKKIIQRDEIRIIPESRKNEVFQFIQQGLEDVSFSRPRKDLAWGIPVPGDDTQTIYVWCDALVNYLSAISYGQDQPSAQEKWWPADVHVIGKDILRFHAIIWPAMLLSAGLALPKNILVHGFITSGGKKMSKSLGNVVDPFELVDRHGADAVRYYLLHEISTTEDGDFTNEHFREVYTADLAHNLGNLVSRVTKLAEGYGKPIFPKGNSAQQIVDRSWESYGSALSVFQLREALDAPMEIVSFANRYIDEKKPWEAIKQSQISNLKSQTNGTKAVETLASLMYMLGNIGWMLQPFLPETAGKIFAQLGIDKNDQAGWSEKGLQPKKGEALFPPIV